MSVQLTSHVYAPSVVKFGPVRFTMMFEGMVEFVLLKEILVIYKVQLNIPPGPVSFARREMFWSRLALLNHELFVGKEKEVLMTINGDSEST